MSYGRELAVFLTLTVAACGGSDTVGPPVDLPITRITQPGFSGFDTPQRLVIRTQADWQTAWETLWRPTRPGPPPTPPPIPSIDFSRDVVIIVAAGAKPTSGYFISVDSVTATRRQATVTVKSYSPGNACQLLEVITQPVEVVAIQARDEIQFRELSEVRHCG
jgi:hypothetical protein